MAFTISQVDEIKITHSQPKYLLVYMARTGRITVCFIWCIS